MEEEELFFKRFSEAKQEQIRGLVQYVTLMDLTGKDLVSIGGKLDRLKAQAERKRNMDIANSFDCLPIGKDRGDAINQRFRLKTANGDYRFERTWGGEWTVTSYQTKRITIHAAYVHQHNLPGRVDWDSRIRYALLLDIDNGSLKLNF